MDQSFNKHLNSMIPDLTVALRSHAETHGWGSHITPHLEIQATGEEIRVHYPEHLRDEIQDLEYGYQHEPPRPAMRTFQPQVNAAVIDAVNKATLDALLGLNP